MRFSKITGVRLSWEVQSKWPSPTHVYTFCLFFFSYNILVIIYFLCFCLKIWNSTFLTTYGIIEQFLNVCYDLIMYFLKVIFWYQLRWLFTSKSLNRQSVSDFLKIIKKKYILIYFFHSWKKHRLHVQTITKETTSHLAVPSCNSRLNI